MFVNTSLLLSLYVSICIVIPSFCFTFPVQRAQPLPCSRLQPSYSKSSLKNDHKYTLALESVKSTENSEITQISTTYNLVSKLAISNMLLFSIVSSAMADSAPILAAADAPDKAILIFAKPILDVFINLMNLLFLSRVIISWYPKTNKGKLVGALKL